MFSGAEEKTICYVIMKLNEVYCCFAGELRTVVKFLLFVLI